MCGIFGFAGKLGNHEFNTLKFATLGAINDSRGGDSAGAFIDKKFRHAVGDQKLFLNFAIKNDFLRQFTGVPVQYALGHCRKASVGAKTILEAQPVVINNDANTDTDFVMIHNGTLLNHEDLKEEYLSKVPIHFTDSQIFAHIVYYYGFKVLTEYNGAGAFVFLDYRKKVPTLYIFKGESPLYKSSTKLSEERPLFWVKKEEGIWFSSIKESLELLDCGESTVEAVPANTLIIIQNGKVVGTKKYDRSKNYQCNTRVYYGSNYDDYDYGYSGYYRANNKDCTPNYSKSTDLNKELLRSTTDFILSERESTYDNSGSHKIIFKNGLYYRGGDLLDGGHSISEYGFENVYSSSGYSSVVPPKEFYFFKGYLLKDALNYEIAKAIEKELGDKFKLDYIRKLVMTAYYDLKTKRFYTRKGKAFTGSYPVYFSLANIKYNISNGYIYQYVEKYDPKTCNAWKLYSPIYSGKDVAEKYAHLIRKSTAKIISQIKD